MGDRLRDALERRARSFRPSDDPLEHVLDRARRRQRTRRLGTAFVALVLFAGAATGAWFAFRSSPSPLPSDERVLPASLGGPINQVVTGAGSVWASVWTGATEDDLSGDIVRLNPDTGEIVARIHLDEAGAIAIGYGSVWVTNLRGQSITKIDTETN